MADIIRLIKMSNTVTLYVAVVDDDENFCRSLGRLLRAAGMQPITYASAEEFLADTKHPLFDCLVLDVHLGGYPASNLASDSWPKAAMPLSSASPLTRIPKRAHSPKQRVAPAFFRKTDSGAAVLDAIRRVAR